MSADFTPFIAHTVLPAAALNAALTGVDTEAQLGVSDAQAASTAATAAATEAGTAETTAQAADTLAAAAIPSSELGAVSGVAELDATGHVLAAELPASTGSSGGAPDAWVVFQGFNVSSTGSFTSVGPTILSSKNVSSVDDADGEGLWQINLTNDAPSANFAVAAFAKFDVAADDNTLAIIAEPRRLMPGAPSATSADVPTSTVSYLQLRAAYQGAGTSPSAYGTVLLYRVSIWFTS